MKDMLKDLWVVWILLGLVILVMVIFHIKFNLVAFAIGFTGGAIGSLISSRIK